MVTYPLDGNLKPVSSLITILAIVSSLVFPAIQKNGDDCLGTYTNVKYLKLYV